MISVYIIVRALVALLVLISIYVHASDNIPGHKGVLWGAVLGLIAGPWLICIIFKGISRAIKHAAVWLVIYGIIDYVIILEWAYKEWSDKILWLSWPAIEMFLFVFFALNLWSYAVAIVPVSEHVSNNNTDRSEDME